MRYIVLKAHHGRASRADESPQTRNWDVYVPDKEKPKILIEVMYMITTASGMTNKRKVVLEEGKKYLGKVFVLMDGIGWMARWSDAKKLKDAPPIYVFSFHKDSIQEMIERIKKLMHPEQ